LITCKTKKVDNKMDLFKRKAKEVTAGQGQAGPPGDGHKGDTRVHATIGAMERGAVEHMVRLFGPKSRNCLREKVLM
jgi:hypothetical protein